MPPAPLRLRVVGSSPSVPRPDRACSCHLLRTSRTAVLFDLGTGALSKLRDHMDYTDVDAVVISHMHADHFIDLVPLRYGLKYGPLTRAGRLPVWLPPGGEAMLRALCATFARESDRDFLDEVYEIAEYDPSEQLAIGDLTLTFAKTVHYIDCFAMRAETRGASVCYSADTAPSEAVERLARGCSLFLCESALGLSTEQGPRGHLSAIEAGEMAQRAGARRLLLTHYGTDYAPGELEDAAEAVFTGPCAVADDGTELFVS